MLRTNRSYIVWSAMTLSLIVGCTLGDRTASPDRERSPEPAAPRLESKRGQAAEEPVQPEPELTRVEPGMPDRTAEACFSELMSVDSQLLATATEARGSLRCSTAADCTLIDLSISCQSMCLSAVPRAAVKTTQARLAALEGRLCGRPRACKMTHTCLELRQAICVAGQCVPDVSPWNPQSEPPQGKRPS